MRILPRIDLFSVNVLPLEVAPSAFNSKLFTTLDAELPARRRPNSRQRAQDNRLKIAETPSADRK
jgi:hypothetical protein